MDLLGAVTYLRENILDDVGGLNADWTTFTEIDTSSLQLRWTNEELTANINEAVNQVFRRILPIEEIEPTFAITTVIGTANYNLDSRILQISGIRSDSTGKTLSRLDLEDVWDDKNLMTTQGTPQYYIPNFNTGAISFYRIPKAIDTYSILAYRLPMTTLSWTTNTDIIELREEFSIPMLWYAASLSYDKDEANTLDPNRAIYFLQKFNQEFPYTSAYSDTRKRRTSNRSIRYGGY